MLLCTFILILAAIGLAAMGGRLWQRQCSDAGLRNDWTVPFAFALAVLLLADFAAQVMDSPFNKWNGVRLAPALGLRMGINVYPALNSGAITGHIYGPVGALTYVPATYFTSPDAAIEAGAALTVLLLMLPVVLWTKTVSGGVALTNVLRVLTVFWLLAMLLASLDYVFRNIHVDAPALCFGGLAGYYACRRRKEREWKAWFLPAVLVVLSVWSKQTMVPLLLALPVCVWWWGGRLPAGRFAVWVVVCGAMMSGVFFVWFGFDRLWLNLVRVPSAHPWILNIFTPHSPLVTAGHFTERLEAVCWSAVDLLREIGLPALVWLVSSAVRRLSGETPVTSESRVARCFLSVMALAGASTAVLGRVKQGGDMNAFSYTTYFLCLAVALHVVETWNLCGYRLFSLQPVLRRLMVGLTLLVLGIIGWQKAVALTAALRRAPSYNEQAAAYLRKHPGEAYFPWQPLSHLLVDQHYYHFSYGVLDREMAGLPISEEHCRNGEPEHLREVFVFSTGYMSALNYLKGFQKCESPEGMTNWVCYVRSQPGR